MGGQKEDSVPPGKSTAHHDNRNTESFYRECKYKTYAQGEARLRVVSFFTTPTVGLSSSKVTANCFFFFKTPNSV